MARVCAWHLPVVPKTCAQVVAGSAEAERHRPVAAAYEH